MKHATNILIAQDGLVLAVSRRNDPTLWGLPGGKVDAGEEHLHACIRETREETGVVVYKNELQPLMSARSVGEVDYWATTYLYTGPHINDTVLEAEPGLFIAWKTWAILVDVKQSPFWAYNMRLRDAYLDYTDSAQHGQRDLAEQVASQVLDGDVRVRVKVKIDEKTGAYLRG